MSDTKGGKRGGETLLMPRKILERVNREISGTQGVRRKRREKEAAQRQNESSTL